MPGPETTSLRCLAWHVLLPPPMPLSPLLLLLLPPLSLLTRVILIIHIITHHDASVEYQKVNAAVGFVELRRCRPHAVKVRQVQLLNRQGALQHEATAEAASMQITELRRSMQSGMPAVFLPQGGLRQMPWTAVAPAPLPLEVLLSAVWRAQETSRWASPVRLLRGSPPQLFRQPPLPALSARHAHRTWPARTLSACRGHSCRLRGKVCTVERLIACDEQSMQDWSFSDQRSFHVPTCDDHDVIVHAGDAFTHHEHDLLSCAAGAGTRHACPRSDLSSIEPQKVVIKEDVSGANAAASVLQYCNRLQANYYSYGAGAFQRGTEARS